MASRSGRYLGCWEWLERIVRDGSVRQEDVETNFGWQSDNDSPTPAGSVYQLITEHCRGFTLPQLDAAVLMSQAARAYAQNYVSQNDHAVLTASEAKARNDRYFRRRNTGTDYGVKRENEDLTAATSLFLEAADLFRSYGNHPLQRHSSWLAANLLEIQGRTAEAADALIDACLGSPRTATKFLYLNIATRYFRLPMVERHHVRRAVLMDLAAAYSWLPAHDIYEVTERPPDAHSTFSVSESLSDEVRQRLQLLLREESPPDNDVTPTEGGREVTTAALPAGEGETGEAWSATAMDRIGILTMLADTEEFEAGAPEARWRFEAAQYAGAWPELEKLCETPSDYLQPLINLIADARQRGGPRPPLLPSPWLSVPPAVIKAMSEGKMAVAEGLLREALAGASSEENPHAWAGLIMRLSRCIAILRSSSEAASVLRSGLDQIPSPVTPLELSARAALLRQLAFTLKNTGVAGVYLPLYESLNLAGRAADVIGIGSTARRLGEEAYHLGDNELTRHCNGLVRSLRYAWATEVQPLDFFFEHGFGEKKPITIDQAQDSLTRLLSPEADLDLSGLTLNIALALEQHPAQFTPVVCSVLSAIFERVRPVGAHTFVIRIIKALQKQKLSPAVNLLLQREYVARLDAEMGSSTAKKQRARVAASLIDQTVPLLMQNQEGDKTLFAGVYEALMRAKKMESYAVGGPSNRPWGEPATVDGFADREDADESSSPVSLSEVRQLLRSQNACAVDFILQGSNSLAVCVAGDDVRVYGVDPSAWEALKGKVAPWMRSCCLDKNVSYVNAARPLDNLCRMATGGDRGIVRGVMKEFEHHWDAASTSLLPVDLQEFILRYALVYFCPHKGLYDFPMHLTRLHDGVLLCERKQVLYTRSVGDLAERAATPKTGLYIAVNTDDVNIEKAAGEFIPKRQRVQNRWHAAVSVTDRLADIQAAGLTLLIAHGMRHKDPRLTSLGFPRGGRLQVSQVQRSSNDFTGCEILAMSCHSGASKVSDGAATLGLCGAFLERDADAVLGCLWEPILQEGVRFAGAYLSTRERGRSRAEAYQDALLEVLYSADTPAEGLLYAAPFFLFSRQNTVDN